MKIKLRKGFDIKLAGKPQSKRLENSPAKLVAFKPTDFFGILRPKVVVNVGDTVQAGSPIFFDKKMPQAKFTSPVSGEVVEVVRGEKRVPLAIKILADAQTQYVQFPSYSATDLAGLDRATMVDNLLASGVWPNIIERPFGIVADPSVAPRDIFISAYDSAPLAPDYNFVFAQDVETLQAGIQVLQKLTNGKIHLSIAMQAPADSVFRKLAGVTLHEFSGPHPSGNVGVQIHHIAPINKGETVWTLTPYALQQIGRLFLTGKYDASKLIALSGSELKDPQYAQVITGASVEALLANNLKNDHVRVISGNVLTGESIGKDGFLGFHATQVTVIPEGDYHEFLGWILPTAKKLSFHNAFGLLSSILPKKEYVLDSNLHGEERAFVQTGVFEQLVPMDIYPIFLLKAIMANDFEEMEALGIYEVLEEDLALCEFADVSKMEIQAIVRDGLQALQEA